MRLKIPAFSLVALVGASGSGKSTFAREHFAPTEVLSSDTFRGLVSDDETDQAATKDAFEALYFVAGKRLANRKLTVVDATNVQAHARKGLVALARQYHCLPVAIVLDLDPSVCQQRNRERTDRDFGRHVVRNQALQLRKSLKDWAGRGSATSTRSPILRRWPQPWSSGRSSGPTGVTSMGRSTSSATSTAVSTSCGSCWRRSDGRWNRRKESGRSAWSIRRRGS